MGRDGNDTFVGQPVNGVPLACVLVMMGLCLPASAGRVPGKPAATKPAKVATEPRTSMGKDDGYRGIWYCNGPTRDEYAYKYAGGLGTYCAKHSPMAIYSAKADKTFFCYGGTAKGKRELLEMVSYYDHATGMVPRPTILMDKGTSDAHDNPVVSMDDRGFIFVFCSSHGTARPSYIFKSDRPYSVGSFTVVYKGNFSYPQPWYWPGEGFVFIHTLYRGGRASHWSTSRDGITWSEPQLLALVDEGHYQVSRLGKGRLGVAFNYHPKAFHGDPTKHGLDWRTNLYYVQTTDFGRTWTNVNGEQLALPLKSSRNAALVHDYEAENLLVYLKDVNYDADGHPVVLFITSDGPQPGPRNGPRAWNTARWTGSEWDIRPLATSDNNYDTGSLYIESDGLWRMIGPTEPGPQRYNPGGEIAVWISRDEGRSWAKSRELTHDSPLNHGYVRRPVNAHPDFYGFWADGNGREPSESRLYFCNRDGDRVWRLPAKLTGEFEKPEVVK
jgi:hypothetical protein